MNLWWTFLTVSSMYKGTLASEYSDVGRYADEDRCCREHDLCPYTLSPGECKRGLCNQQQFTRSHCDCDAKFRRCLQALNTGELRHKWYQHQQCINIQHEQWHFQFNPLITFIIFFFIQKLQTHWVLYSSMWFRWHVSKNGVLVQNIKGIFFFFYL